MIVLGTVLLVLVVLLILGIIFTNGTAAPDFTVLGVSVTHVSVGGLFLGGVVTGVVGMLALFLLLGGGARKRHKRVEQKRAVKGARQDASTLEQENAKLRDQLEAERNAAPPVETRTTRREEPVEVRRVSTTKIDDGREDGSGRL